MKKEEVKKEKKKNVLKEFCVFIGRNAPQGGFGV